MLLGRIRLIHQRSFGTYGAPRVHAELCESGVRVGRKRVARLMRMAAICGVSRRRAVRTTWRSEEGRKAPDLVNRRLQRSGQGPAVGSRYYLRTYPCGPPLSLGGHRRLQSPRGRLVHGLSPAKRKLVEDALDMALCQRRPDEVIHHSDQGSQYTSVAFGKRCRQAGVRPSMGSVGDCYDNALCESFFASLECERIDRRRFATKTEARLALIHRGLLQHPEKTLTPRIPLTHKLRKELQENCLNPK